MARFVLEIETDNAAFEGRRKAREVTRILFEVITKLDAGHEDGKVRDINGNTVGSFEFQDE